MYYLPVIFFKNWCKNLKNISQKANFERGYMKLHSCHINIKVGAKGLD